jgi:hypothetical protein
MSDTNAAAPVQRPRIVPQAGPAAWRAEDLRPADWMVPLGTEDTAEIEAVLAGLGGRAPATAAEAPLPRLGAVLRQAATRLDTGRGLVLLRGMKLDRLGEYESAAEALLLVLGTHLGRALPQGPAGEAVQRLESPASGATRWRFHADAADIVALLTLRQPPDVDPAMLVSAAAVHNEMMKRQRPALEQLYAPIPHLLLQGEGATPAVVALPVFSTASGAFVGRYARDAIEAAQRLPETQRLTAAQVEALDALDAVCAEPGLALRMEVRPGDVLLFNPLLVWKRRVEAVEGDQGAVRQAMRLMLVTPSSRALPHGLAAIGEAPPPGASGTMVGG